MSGLAAASLLLLQLLLPHPAHAYPPAPPFTISGIARDAYGWALKSVDQGVVVFKRNGIIVAEAPINETLRPGENFRVPLPMDTNGSDPYRTGVQGSGNLLSIEIRFPNVTMPVASIAASRRTVGQPGGSVFIDFSVGVDTDGDGIPDSWEYWQLGEAGIGPGDPRYSLATLGTGDFDHDGTSDYVEYLAGTFAFLTEESLRLDITGLDVDGSPILRALLVFDKTYRVESSPDLITWSSANVRVDAPTAAPGKSFTASDTRDTAIFAAPSPGQPRLYYRLVLVR